ncbi:hypothetical protein LMG28140_00773 [Paraburkholderia metrosideri]|uniref:Uncharacterized protein n=2 Tax=Paraburkholderia metrosideri TaxID=580937 RepID=A0ABN7HH78_9BURK|nr:hypothetical protein LMG28140_00773 [Paraburkholderia metrosideri]
MTSTALRVAERLVKSCGGGALQELHCLECADRVTRGARLYQTLLIWPYAVAPAIAASGVKFEGLRTEVARHWRSRVLAEQQKDGCRA